jgi:DNA polymerase, archaea type
MGHSLFYMKCEFIPIDYDYFDFQGKNYMKIIGRDSVGKRICVVDSCPVYFWAILEKGVSKKRINEIISKVEKIKLEVKGRNTCVEKVELHDKKFLEKEVQALKIFATNYKDLHDIATQLDFPEVAKRRGYDLGLTTHYIIEKKFEPLKWYEIEGEVIDNSEKLGGIGMHMEVDTTILLSELKFTKNDEFEPRVLAYDIETDELQIGEGEIVMLSLASKNYKKVITWKKGKTKQDFVEYVGDEAEMLERFVECVKEFSPDFLVGYYSDGFDLPYLKARADKHRVNLSLGLDGTQPRFSRGNQLVGKIKGIVHLDLLKFIRTAYAQYMKSETMSLNEVAKEFLGDVKMDFKLKHSRDIKEHEWEAYYGYNLQDSVLTYRLFEKFWLDMLEFVRVVNEPIFNVSRFGLSKHIESYMLHNLYKFNEIPEKQPNYNEINGRKDLGGVKGAFVYEPKPGMYEDIAMFDFTSMHTSIIISMNLSKGTLLEKKEKNSTESPEVEDGTGEKYYFTKKLGFFPTLLNELFLKRKEAKADYNLSPNVLTKARSNAFKVLSASAHGYIGFYGARYYSHETSASILAFVRKFNQDIIKKVEDAGFTVIFGDTDSVAFAMNGKSKSEIKKFLKELNEDLPGVMSLELEGFFKRGLWVTTRGGTTGAKKKYAMIDYEDNLKIRGFETVRRDWCKLSREVQSNIIRMILEEGDSKKALIYLKGIVKKIKERKIDLSELVIKTQLKRPLTEYKANTPHILAARRMVEHEIPLSVGTLIEYYIAETNTKSKLVRDKVKLLTEKGEYEIQYYLEKQILPAVENIFQVFDVNVKEIVDGKKQDSLKKWF